MPKLIIHYDGKKQGEFTLVPGLNTIGRGKDQHISLSDENISRHHARIHMDISENICVFEDLDSLNGSFINHEKVGKKLLKPEDAVFLGKHQLVFIP